MTTTLAKPVSGNAETRDKNRVLLAGVYESTVKNNTGLVLYEISASKSTVGEKVDSVQYMVKGKYNLDVAIERRVVEEAKTLPVSLRGATLNLRIGASRWGESLDLGAYQETFRFADQTKGAVALNKTLNGGNEMRGLINALELYSSTLETIRSDPDMSSALAKDQKATEEEMDFRIERKLMALGEVRLDLFTNSIDAQRLHLLGSFHFSLLRSTVT